MRYLLITIFVVGLIYMLLPGPGSIDRFPPLANSVKSNEPGDTVQVPNVSAYFSDFERDSVTSFYRGEFAKMYLFGFIPPLSLNYSPKDAGNLIRDQLRVTFLEEYTYPLRESVYVGGYEPYVDNNLLVRQHHFIADHLHIDGRYFVSKTTLRIYPTLWIVRLIVYLGIWVAAIALYRLFEETLKGEKR